MRKILVSQKRIGYIGRKNNSKDKVLEGILEKSDLEVVLDI